MQNDMNLLPSPKMLFAVVVVVAIAVTLAILAGTMLGLIHPSMQAPEEAARRALFAEIVRQLQAYAERNHRYPPSINELSITNFPNGSSSALLSIVHYVSDGGSCEVKCESLVQEQPLIRKLSVSEYPSSKDEP